MISRSLGNTKSGLPGKWPACISQPLIFALMSADLNLLSVDILPLDRTRLIKADLCALLIVSIDQAAVKTLSIGPLVWATKLSSAKAD